ncbi:hypothetical protein BX260_7473 [Streptomyces sp. 5112.2]|nr:hypothetical protein BX260_7473 [Streptomyces sp. 5112.2]
MLVGREGRSLHLKAAGGAAIVLVLVMLAGSWAVVMPKRAPATRT